MSTFWRNMDSFDRVLLSIALGVTALGITAVAVKGERMDEQTLDYRGHTIKLRVPLGEARDNWEWEFHADGKLKANGKAVEELIALQSAQAAVDAYITLTGGGA